MYDGINGDTKYQVNSSKDKVLFKSIGFNQTSVNNMLFRLFIGLYR